jgi:hypothetical protein
VDNERRSGSGDQANKMNQTEDIEATLSRMAELLRTSANNDWAVALEKLKDETSQTPDSVARKILSLYGGMGSLNDLVLYSNGRMLHEENKEFDDLRAHLFLVCTARL